ncbi:TetR/AcrR family transcriptional regulator [Tenacibaculum amylolyticum]|uniref:TetR/AcrR family transcriptional regulator n=1 Tax=Tenacibaculum amylolyticum TaxID=104269 RepID=UPI0038934C0D
MKEKIKTTALQLFNETGISTVSMLQIAQKLNISAGNLSYHFKNKELLLEAIFEDLKEESTKFLFPPNEYITLHHFENSMRKFDRVQSKYEFFFNELVHITRVYPSIAKRYEAVNLTRFKESRKLIDYYIETDRLKPENEYTNYDKMIHSIWMISTFWQSQKQIITDTDFTLNKGDFIDFHWNLLIPFLTETGLTEYQQIKKYTNTNPL